MSQSQPLDVPNPVSLDGLDQMFPNQLNQTGSSPALSPDQIDATPPKGVQVHRDFPSDLFTRGFDGVDEIVNEEMSQARSADASADVSHDTSGTFEYAQMRANATRRGIPSKPGPVAMHGQAPMRQIRADELAPVIKKGMESIAANPAVVTEEDRVSRTELIGLLEGFVTILRKDGAAPGSALALAKAQQIMAPVAEELKVHDIQVEDKTQELEEMRRLVIEAQETIIKLLTDRVEDRARIATLETELRLLPDLQEQADRAMSVAFKTEEFRSELHKVKFELERYRFANVRGHIDRGPRKWMTKVRRWFLKAQGLNLRKYDATRHGNIPD
ncbi:MAG: hypothetical protein SGJ27_05330 [Candidatus Melainabacteria bacterium]|nr:hypothetical protein [Candidatus Melainabacteria bacterium]